MRFVEMGEQEALESGELLFVSRKGSAANVQHQTS
jgi:hypothetical protein